jgi:hypothetical protein
MLCYHGVTSVLQWCYHGVTSGHTSVTMVLQVCYNGVTRCAGHEYR